MVCKLLKVLYSLKQASRLWYKRLFKFLLEKLGFKQINANHNIFVTLTSINGPIVSTFINNINVIGMKKLGYIENFKNKLAVVFEMVDIRSISFYLGLKVEKDCQKKTLKLFQPAYINKISGKYHLDLAKSYNTPMKKVILLPNEGQEAIQAEQKQYQGIIGLLMFSMVEIRPDIGFATSVVSHFAKNLSQ